MNLNELSLLKTINSAPRNPKRMNMLPLNQIIQVPDGSLIEAVNGIITKVFPQKARGQKGTLCQDLYISGDGVADQRVTIWTRVEIDGSSVGKELLLASTGRDRGLSGLKARVNTYQGRTTHELSVSFAARVEVGGMPVESLPKDHQAPAPQQATCSPQAYIPQQNQTAPPYQSFTPPHTQVQQQMPAMTPAPAKPIEEEYAMCLHKAYQLCVRFHSYTSDQVIKQTKEDGHSSMITFDYTPEIVKEIATTFFIEGNRRK